MVKAAELTSGDLALSLKGEPAESGEREVSRRHSRLRKRAGTEKIKPDGLTRPKAQTVGGRVRGETYGRGAAENPVRTGLSNRR